MSLKSTSQKLDHLIYLLGVLIRLSSKQESLIENSKKIIENLKQEEFLTSKQVCEILNCSSVTLRKIRKSGELPFSKFRNNIRYKRSDVTNYLL